MFKHHKYSCHFLLHGHTKKQNMTKEKKREQAREKTFILTSSNYIKCQYALR